MQDLEGELAEAWGDYRGDRISPKSRPSPVREKPFGPVNLQAQAAVLHPALSLVAVLRCPAPLVLERSTLWISRRLAAGGCACGGGVCALCRCWLSVLLACTPPTESILTKKRGGPHGPPCSLSYPVLTSPASRSIRSRTACKIYPCRLCPAEAAADLISSASGFNGFMFICVHFALYRSFVIRFFGFIAMLSPHGNYTIKRANPIPCNFHKPDTVLLCKATNRTVQG